MGCDDQFVMTQGMKITWTDEPSQTTPRDVQRLLTRIDDNKATRKHVLWKISKGFATSTEMKAQDVLFKQIKRDKDTLKEIRELVN